MRIAIYALWVHRPETAQATGVVVVRRQNADHMLALRLNRANRQWDSYWNQARKAA